MDPHNAPTGTWSQAFEPAHRPKLEAGRSQVVPSEGRSAPGAPAWPYQSKSDFVQDLKSFLESPDITLITETELIVIPSTSIRQIAITRSDGPIPEQELAAIPGVLVGVKRIFG